MFTMNTVEIAIIHIYNGVNYNLVIRKLFWWIVPKGLL